MVFLRNSDSLDYLHILSTAFPIGAIEPYKVQKASQYITSLVLNAATSQYYLIHKFFVDCFFIDYVIFLRDKLFCIRCNLNLSLSPLHRLFA